MFNGMYIHMLYVHACMHAQAQTDIHTQWSVVPKCMSDVLCESPAQADPCQCRTASLSSPYPSLAAAVSMKRQAMYNRLTESNGSSNKSIGFHCEVFTHSMVVLCM